MADLMTLKATLGLDSSQYESGLKGAQGLASSFSVAFGNLISQGVTAGANALKDFGSYVMNTGMSFESTMSKVGAISGASADQIGQLTEKAKEMGASTKFSATEAGEAFTYMAMAGWDTEKMLGGIEGVMNLAAASGENLANVSDIVTDAMTAFGMEASESGKFADILAQASSNANTTVGLMGETFKYVAPVAGALGYSAEDVAVAVGLMANAGIKGSQAGTALRSTLTNLAKPSDTIAMAMEKLGISLTDSSGEVKPLDVLLNDLRKSFGTLSSAQQAEYAATIAGQQGMSALLAIVNASDDVFNNFTSAIENSEGAAKRMADQMNDNLAGSITILGSAVDILAQEFYSGISGTAKKAVDALTEAVNKAKEKVKDWLNSDQTQLKLLIISEKIQILIDKIMGGLDPALDGLIGIIDKVVDGIGFLIDNFDKIVAAIQLAVEVFVALKVAMAALQFAKFVTSLNPVSVAISALIAIIALLITHWDDVKKGAQLAIQDIKNAWNSVSSWFKGIVSGIASAFAGIDEKIASFFKNAWEKAKSVWNSVTTFFSGIVSNVVNAFQSIPSKISDFFKSAVEKIKSVWQTITSWFGTIVSNVVNAFQSVPDKIKTFFSNALNGVKNTWQAITSWFSGIVNNVINAFQNVPSRIQQFFSNAWNNVKNAWNSATSWFSSMASNIINGFTSIPSRIQNFFANAWNSVKNAWSSATSHFSSVGSNIVSAISRAISGLPSQALGWARDMMQGFANGITRFMSTVTQPIKNLASKIASFLHFSRPDEGPLRDYEQWMPDFLAGMAKGIEQNTWRLENAAEDAAQILSGGFSDTGLSSLSGTNTLGNNGLLGSGVNITINIDGAKYNDERSLAEAISEELQGLVARRQAVFA